MMNSAMACAIYQEPSAILTVNQGSVQPKLAVVYLDDELVYRITTD
jgi:hypothetical protein